MVVDVLNNGNDAISVLSSANFDVVVMDIMIPGPDGLSVLRRMRSRGFASPVLLLSARGKPMNGWRG